ncbi:MAG: diguanylate cyclase [Thermoanaerobaculia bacterium]|nr:diguanylate cyclase [Thermoanaerobaculia bacterium]
MDDQAATRQALHHMFRDHCEVVLASNGYKALEICRRQPPDLVLLDILMPEMDGYETCRRLKSEPATREIPIIFVTSENRPDQEARALEYGAVDFISKPLIPAVVRARVGTHLTLKAQADMLRCLAFVDGLTSIGNRRLFDDRLDLEWRACRRNRSSLSLLMIDIDHFKRYNDRLGHQQGDLCLKEVASILSGELSRSRDFLARYGGEEFACLLPETDLQGALAKAKALKEAVESREIPHPDSDCSEFVTICIGVASTLPQPGQSASDLVGAADGELYRAKSAGRNRIAVREPTPANPRPLEGKRPPIETPRRLAQTVRLVASAAG